MSQRAQKLFERRGVASLGDVFQRHAGRVAYLEQGKRIGVRKRHQWRQGLASGQVDQRNLERRSGWRGRHGWRRWERSRFITAATACYQQGHRQRSASVVS